MDHAHLIFVNYKLSHTLITPPYLTHANQSCAFFCPDRFNCGIRYVVNLQQSFQFNLPAKICHNLVCSEDHVVFNASLAFPPKTWTAGFSGPFFFDTHVLFQRKSRQQIANGSNCSKNPFIITQLITHQTHLLT